MTVGMGCMPAQATQRGLLLHNHPQNLNHTSTQPPLPDAPPCTCRCPAAHISPGSRCRCHSRLCWPLGSPGEAPGSPGAQFRGSTAARTQSRRRRSSTQRSCRRGCSPGCCCRGRSSQCTVAMRGGVTERAVKSCPVSTSAVTMRTVQLAQPAHPLAGVVGGQVLEAAHAAAGALLVVLVAVEAGKAARALQGGSGLDIGMVNSSSNAACAERTGSWAGTALAMLLASRSACRPAGRRSEMGCSAGTHALQQSDMPCRGAHRDAESLLIQAHFGWAGGALAAVVARQAALVALGGRSGRRLWQVRRGQVGCARRRRRRCMSADGLQGMYGWRAAKRRSPQRSPLK